MKKIRIASILLFILLIGSCAVWSFISPVKKYSDRENRNLQQAPKLTKKRVLSGKFQKKYETYLSDQIFMRDQWVDFYSNMEHMMGKKEINGIYLGKDGFLLEKYEEEDFDKEQQSANIEILSNFLNVCSDSLGEENVSCLFVPSKAEVLAEKLPVFADVYQGNSVVGAVKEQVKNKDSVRNLKTELLRHKGEYIFYRTDHHWTTLGAYYGYCAYEQMKNKVEPSLDAYRQEVIFRDFLGTTYNKAHVKTTPDEVSIFHTDFEDVKVNEDDGEVVSDSFYFKDTAAESFDRYRLFLSKNTGKIEITTGSRTGRTLLMVKDSFANCFVPFLAAEYDRIILIDCRYNKGRIGSIFKDNQDITDVLVLFNIEKFRQDTHLSYLKIRSAEIMIEKGDKKNDGNKSEEKDIEEDDILDGLISLD